MVLGQNRLDSFSRGHKFLSTEYSMRYQDGSHIPHLLQCLDWRRPRLCSLHRQENNVSERGDTSPLVSINRALLQLELAVAHSPRIHTESDNIRSNLADHRGRPDLGRLAFRVSADRA